jgi:hypothetical protein
VILRLKGVFALRLKVKQDLLAIYDARALNLTSIAKHQVLRFFFGQIAFTTIVFLSLNDAHMQLTRRCTTGKSGEMDSGA